MKRKANSIKNGRKWRKKGGPAITNCARQHDCPVRYWRPRRRIKRWVWKAPEPIR